MPKHWFDSTEIKLPVTQEEPAYDQNQPPHRCATRLFWTPKQRLSNVAPDPLAGPLRSQAEMSHLFFPFDRQIDEAGHPEAAWQSSFDGGLNDIWSEEGE